MNFLQSFWPIFLLAIATRCETEEQHCSKDDAFCTNRDGFEKRMAKRFLRGTEEIAEGTIPEVSEVIKGAYILGGEDVLQCTRQYAHAAALAFYHPSQKRYAFGCGGTIIADNFVLTAAHCIQNPSHLEVAFVRLGALVIPPTVEEMDVSLDYEVRKTYVHEDYDRLKKLSDIALVEVKDQIRFSSTVLPIMMYAINEDPEKMVALAWGAAQFRGEQSMLLHKVDVTSVPVEECDKFYRPSYGLGIESSHICAGNEDKSTCEGDSGGPLQVTMFNTWFLVGVRAAGGMCESGMPGMYTRVYTFDRWIKDTVENSYEDE